MWTAIKLLDVHEVLIVFYKNVEFGDHAICRIQKDVLIFSFQHGV